MSEVIDALCDSSLEHDVLGQLLSYRLAEAFLAAGLRAEHFRTHKHRLIFDASAAVTDRGETADMVTVREELRRSGAEEEVGTLYFMQLGDLGGMGVLPRPTAANIQASVKGLRQLTTLRSVYYASGRLQKDIAEARKSGDSGVLAPHLANLEALLAEDVDEDDLLDADAQLAAYAADLRRDDLARVWFGFPSMDEAIDGLRPGEVCGVMARPGLGKTLLLCAIARYAAEMDLGHLFFSLEMPPPQIVERLKRALYSLGRRELKERVEGGHVDPTTYRNVFKRFIVVGTPGLSVADMAMRVKRAPMGPLNGHPVRVVTIDHLGLIGGDRRMATYDRVSTQARELKELAKRHEVAVLLAIQVNRDAGGDGSRELGLGSARDSGVVEEVMDFLIAARRLDRSETLSAVERERYRDVLFMKIVKNRRESPSTRETAVRLDPRTLVLREDPDLRIDDDDMARIAQTRRR